MSADWARKSSTLAQPSKGRPSSKVFALSGLNVGLNMAASSAACSAGNVFTFKRH
ncbi:Uncharacterised protein [Vibrio cholerae]|uniref:Uncharacterized protein n=1 Tax=Vibrio cholerae TaxID=666 RepID=A0A655WWA5_VIBCL|nr:Uncharacterised protein [Vibrio cholerae]CSB99518.1 Uncharacterised protein [Vibrio cholerae]CSD02455.1 Uncharacterised protein [Vibrio cholerae]